ncbi:kinase-like protein [Mytilinidion resinicola]|uniref:Kinase-like protein n=1 Tax=Mytilinidion resinicola TaxID=574789 RepID=A0A6A6YKP7_9PEZI|nr:kinase-like protein [Mytilinidion resinicola]KAF2809370.1 kinase-like protein [Mytilinidion resinicola]
MDCKEGLIREGVRLLLVQELNCSDDFLAESRYLRLQGFLEFGIGASGNIFSRALAMCTFSWQVARLCPNSPKLDHTSFACLNILACKVIYLDGTETGKAAIVQEVSVLSRLRHPNIVEYYDVEWLANEAKLYLEYCNAQTLDDYRSQASEFPAEKEVWNLAFQLSSALAYCRSGMLRGASGRLYKDCLNDFDEEWKPILHRVIKPWNVLVNRHGENEPTFKLADFGFGVILSDKSFQMSFTAGTRGYIAPEVPVVFQGAGLSQYGYSSQRGFGILIQSGPSEL